MSVDISSKRLKEIRIDSGLNQKEFAKKFGIKESTYSRYENGSIGSLPSKKIGDICSAYNINPSYLTGLSDQIKLLNDKTKDSVKLIPLLGTIAAGTPIFADENIESYECSSGDKDVHFCLRVKGDSMKDVYIKDGDIVFVRKQPDVENKEIAVVMIDDEEATLKRVSKADGLIILKAENKDYDDRAFSKKEINRLKILGKVMYVKSEVK